MSFRDDPFVSRVHPLFWPVLWLSLRWLAGWTQREIEAGRGDWFTAVSVTWYGRIFIVRHVAPDWNGRLARHCAVAEALLRAPVPAFPADEAAMPGCLVRGPVAPTYSGCGGLSAGLAGRLARATGPPAGRATVSPLRAAGWGGQTDL